MYLGKVWKYTFIITENASDSILFLPLLIYRSARISQKANCPLFKCLTRQFKGYDRHLAEV